jgi:hypothetical protein
MGTGQAPTRTGMRRVEVLDAFVPVDCSDHETVNGATRRGPRTGTVAGHHDRQELHPDEHSGEVFAHWSYR